MVNDNTRLEAVGAFATKHEIEIRKYGTFTADLFAYLG